MSSGRLVECRSTHICRSSARPTVNLSHIFIGYASHKGRSEYRAALRLPVAGKKHNRITLRRTAPTRLIQCHAVFISLAPSRSIETLTTTEGAWTTTSRQNSYMAQTISAQQHNIRLHKASYNPATFYWQLLTYHESMK